MDRRPARARRLILAALAAAGASAALAAAGADPPLRAQRWIAKGADPWALARIPTECLARPASPEAALSVEVGRAAFHTPTLLGGQGARAGVSCEACHRGGRSNPDFAFPGLSGAPGTADVTSSILSSHRGDGVFDPRPIPDLAGPRTALKVDRAPESRALETFIHGLVTEEFDGREPPKTVMAGLAAYVRALGPGACPAAADQALSAGLYLEDARRAVRAADALAAQGDFDGAGVMVAAARARLGLIDERYAGPRMAAEQRRLRSADRMLAGAAQALREGKPAKADLQRWLAGSSGLEAALARRAGESLFNPDRLAATASPLPPQAR